jgi:hypothetical protein
MKRSFSWCRDWPVVVIMFIAVIFALIVISQWGHKPEPVHPVETVEVMV